MALIKVKEVAHKIPSGKEHLKIQFFQTGMLSDTDVTEQPLLYNLRCHIWKQLQTSPQPATAMSRARAEPPVLQRVKGSLLACSQVLLHSRYKNTYLQC